MQHSQKHIPCIKFPWSSFGKGHSPSLSLLEKAISSKVLEGHFEKLQTPLTMTPCPDCQLQGLHRQPGPCRFLRSVTTLLRSRNRPTPPAQVSPRCPARPSPNVLGKVHPSAGNLGCQQTMDMNYAGKTFQNILQLSKQSFPAHDAWRTH